MSAENSRKEPQRRPATRVSFVEWLVVVALLVIAGAIVFPLLTRARKTARFSHCMDNMKELTFATLRYAEEHDDRLPDAATWAQDVEPYLRARHVLKCPADKTNQAISYAMVRRWGGVKLEDIPNRAETILIYEVEQGTPAYRHDHVMSVGYADGHVTWLSELPPDALDPADTTGIMPGTAAPNAPDQQR